MKFSKVCVSISLCVFYFLLGTKINAQDSPVPPNSVPCGNVANTEFHSLRPYQANSTCQSATSDYAKFCGNTLTLQETITKTYVPKDPSCKTGSGKITCSYIENVPSHTVVIDLSGANLPIMGNTEEVTNYKGEADQLTDAQKVNGYVSWYLNGVVNRKEYPEKTDATSFVNYSGPVAKLLPQEIQLAKRVETIENAIGKNLDSGQESIQQNRHDQIVVCTEDKTIEVPIFDIKIPLPGVKIAGKCEEVKGVASNSLRISQWNDNLSDFTSITNLVLNTWGGVTGFFAKLLNNYPLEKISQYLQETPAWNLRTPPLSWNFTDPILYKKAYNEWQGKVCILIPFPTRFSVCAESFLIPNMWADLFPYIPLSSTEDLEGNIKVDSASSGSGNEVKNVTFSNQTPSTLFFPHIQESDELGSTLQDTYIGKGEEKTGADTAVAPSSSCNTVDVRSNKGDSLFAKSLTGDLSYTASFACDFKTEEQQVGEGACQLLHGEFVCPGQSCTKNVSISLSTTGSIPKVDDVWSRLVAGPTAIVKRLFPKLGTQIGTLKDIPGSTSVSYQGAQASTGELNLPHVGGISEYFLKGIQTLLRPKGYGETVSFGETTTSTETSKDVCGVASRYKIPCCVLQGIIEVETGNNPKFIGSDLCKRNGRVFDCCNGNYCGPTNIACSQYMAWNGNDDLDLCDPTDSAELLARALLYKLCQADKKCAGGWATNSSYILENYSIEGGDYTAAAYFYGLQNGCRVTSCSQFRWGEGKGYCDAVKYYCDNKNPIGSKTDAKYCEKCNEEEMIPAGMPINCSLYQ